MSEALNAIVRELANVAPDAAALVHRERVVGYGELDGLADRYAAALVRAGVREGDLVPVSMPRGVDLVVAILGILKAGAAYALLDPAWPRRRVDDVLADLGARVVVGEHGIPVPSRIPTGTLLRPVPVDPGNACCAFFTSGTTGRPKAVLTPHRAISRLFRPCAFAELGPGSVMPSAAPLPWDAFALELWAMLLTGGTSLLVDEPYLSPVELRAAIADHGVDSAWLTASLFNLAVDEDIEAFSGLKQLLIGGERLSAPHVRRFMTRHPDIALTNGYGPVENTIFTTTHRIGIEDCATDIPIGKPVTGTQVHVLRGEEPCPVGESGELCLSGTGLAIGYVGSDPGRFTTVKIGGVPTRVYRSGDLGRWDASGLLRYEGRLDRQVKVRGHRVEPGEVERQIEALPRVRACAVLARRNASGAVDALLAFCVPADPADRLADLGLDAVLPGYQLPAAVLPVDAFPLTDNGKLDERALLAMTPPTGEERDDVEAADPLISRVVGVFAAVLGRTSVPADVPFTELGGTSLDAGRVSARLAAQLGRPVPVSRLLREPTARGLAAWLGRPPGDPPGQDPPNASVPLSSMQVGFLTKALLEPEDRSAYCVSVWSVGAPLDLSALRSAVRAVHHHHEPLRSTYAAGRSATATPGSHPPPDPLVLPEADSVGAGVAALRRVLSAHLDLGSGEVWRVAVVPLPGRTLLGYVVHHIAFDGWSESVLAEDLATAYSAVSAGRPVELGTVPGLAETWAIRQRELEYADLPAQRAQVVSDLRGLPELVCPGAGIPGAAAPARIIRQVRTEGIDPAGATRFTVLLAAYARALAELTDSTDFGIGVPVATRSDQRLDRVVGCHIDMVCVRMTAGGLDDWARAVQRALRTQDVGFGEAVRLVNPPRSRRTPLFQNIFAYQNNAKPRMRLAGVDAELIRGGYLGIATEILTEVWEDSDEVLRIVVNYRPDVIAVGFAERLAARFAANLGDRDDR
ncbi:AMP-binding protein [Actinokineospora fastidiosa]|uniref:Carrier domain-containing protein n=1 Tax=Actinokineospora fastidiosa TaxID=1816 RepID=A0A918GCQ2_9PSEU|nr:AMP-binding protein [Actinokineospora fastidiosa]GGS28844.1 hypothetical protein GCM10010171_22490 [Actinokineospora fastidiosa]